MKLACQNCGANIIFDVKTQKCYCEHCNTFINIDEIKSLDIISKEMTCSSCGAKLMLSENEIIVNCVYCGSTELFSTRLEVNANNFKPKEILPFKIDKENAMNLYLTYIKKHKKLFLKPINEEIVFNNLKGIYVPTCLYIWKLQVYHMKRKKEILYEETRFDTRDVSWKVKEEAMKAMQPFDVENLVEFSPMYFANFYAETADERIFIKDGEIPSKFVDEQPYKEAMKKIYATIENPTEQELYAIQTNINLLEKKAIFLPIWYLPISHKIKFFINGRTGKVVCLFRDENEKNQIYTTENMKKIKKQKRKDRIKEKIKDKIRLYWSDTRVQATVFIIFFTLIFFIVNIVIKLTK